MQLISKTLLGKFKKPISNMRLNLNSSRLGEAVQIGDNIYIVKTLVAIGGGDGHLTHKGLRQRFLHNLQDGREEQILQVCTQS